MEKTEKLIELCRDYKLDIDRNVAEALCKYLEQLLKTNETMNLTAITEWDEAVEKHLADCLLAAAMPEIKGWVADVGTGAGFPAVVIKALKPSCTVTAIDSTEKKLSFVKTTSDSCGIPCQTLHIRAEDAGKSPLYRESFDTVTARAVAFLPTLCEYCLPLVRQGGYFVAMKGRDGMNELEAAKGAIKKLGGELERTEVLTLSDGSQRVNIVIKKVSPTPTAYPRKQKDIKNKPL